ncbi:MAG: Gfo/Idh/MocA family oxidoreductase [Acidobacteria bacterium]|nr:Gfo/Idh/MocA family oxidoreductase [Acidobacteriota bacterium]
MQDTIGRRQFAGKSAAAAAAFMIVKPESVRGSQANSALTLGLIGCGNRGTYVTGLFSKHEYLRVTGLCDIYEDKIKAAAGKWSDAKTYRNYKDVLASDVDAVYIATPAFLHPEHFEAAVDARKHIFMEKPAAVNAEGCHRVLRAARKADKSKRITVDFQQRYGADYRKALEVMKSGELGALRMIRAAWLGGGPAIKSGHAAEEEKIRNWFFYRELSGDIVIEQDCHNIDVVNWYTGKQPVRASGYGSRQVRQYGDIFDNISCTFQFDDGMVFSYSANQFKAPGFSDVSETFMCEKGAVNVSRRGYTIWREKGEPESVRTTHDITQDAVREFIDGARTGKIENAGFHAASSTLTAVMCLESCVKAKEVTWEQLAKGENFAA